MYYFVICGLLSIFEAVSLESFIFHCILFLWMCLIFLASFIVLLQNWDVVKEVFTLFLGYPSATY